jgi:hypothetical protein
MSKKSGLIEQIQEEIVKHIPKPSKSIEPKVEVFENKTNPDHLQGHLTRGYKSIKKDGE